MPTALVVGGTSGIGLATARRLLDRGATVHVAGRRPATIAEITETDPGLHSHRLDANDPVASSGLMAEIGQIDWLVITLSGSEGAGPFAGLDLGTLRRVFDAKLWPTLTVLQAALPHLAPGGSITLFGAVSARTGMPGTAGLAAVNGAIEALVRPLAAELAPIRVNAISPGLVDTPWWAAIPDQDRNAYFGTVEKLLPARHIATAEDIAELTAVAATNPNLTGTVFEADGGARLVTLQ